MATSTDMLLTRKYKQESEELTARDEDSDEGELSTIESPSMLQRAGSLRSKSVSLDLPLPHSLDSDGEESLLTRSTPHGSAASTPHRDELSSGRASSPNNRPQLNGRQSPGSHPTLPPVTPRGEKSLNSSFNKRKTNWFSYSYKQKCEEFHRLFKDIPADERLLVDYSCALQKDILVHGRLYMSQNWICFYASIFKWETTVMIECKEIKSITKEKTARVIPNAIQINTLTDKYSFSSFSSRDKTYLLMFRVWQNSLLDKVMNQQQVWQLIHELYGSQLGITQSDDDYEAPTQDSDAQQTADTCSFAGSDNTGITNGLSSAMPSTAALDAVAGTDRKLDDVSKDLSSDLTDSTETDDDGDGEAVQCPSAHEHSDWVTLDLEVNFSVNQLFDLLFTDTPFFAAFLDSQGTTDINLGEWSEPDAEGVRRRENTFTIAVNASFGPKSTRSTETQYMRAESKPGSFYCIDCESLSDPSLPYGDNFYVWNRYCISRITKSSCHVVVRTKICYMKSVFALVKAVIDKNVRNGVNSYFKPLTEKLSRESDKMATSGEQPRKKKRYVRHRAASVHSRHSIHLSNGTVPGKSQPSSQQHQESNSSRKAAYITSTVRVMSALLIFLVIFNLLLFFKLWSLETRHAAMQMDSSTSGMYTHQELVDLLNKQKFLYEKDMNHWRETLESSTKLIYQLEESIEEIKLRQNILDTTISPEKLPESYSES
ncbi:protein Aster-A-like isoform X2 [Watersipora subatra]|uniref:protein Aster-A-like isoform X2 n=1 Tax=Watersipora subatra TaxID=2589382 RepID=UPI00355B651F